MQAFVVLIIFIVLNINSAFLSYSPPRVVNIEIPLARLPACLDGYKLAFLADLHAGALVGAKETERITALLTAMDANAVVLVGDIGDQPVDDVAIKKLLPLASVKNTDGIYWASWAGGGSPVSLAHVVPGPQPTQSSGNHENLNGINDYR